MTKDNENPEDGTCDLCDALNALHRELADSHRAYELLFKENGKLREQLAEAQANLSEIERLRGPWSKVLG